LNKLIFLASEVISQVQLVSIISSLCFDETVAGKGSDEVTSMINDFIENHLSREIVELELFCDGCAGQNKNYTLVRYFHWLVHEQKRFNKITVSYPIRGHSYMECDRDMNAVDCKSDVDLPSGWVDVFRNARKNPTPFNVIPLNAASFLNYTAHLKPRYKSTCPFKTRPMRQLFISASENKRAVLHRDSWNGVYQASIVCKPSRARHLPPLTPINTTSLPISKAKYEDLQVLKRFCAVENKNFYDNLKYTEGTVDNDEL